jgi:Flp pilus assembly protein TadG
MPLTDPDRCWKQRIAYVVRCMMTRDNTGGAIVELALVVPIFAALLLGAAEFASLEYAGIETSNAARAGVAYGSQSSTTAADTSGMQAAATNDGKDVSGLAAVAKQFWSCSNAPSTQSSSPPTCSSGNHLLNYVQVTTTATVTPVVHLPGLPAVFTLHGLAIMRVQ